MLTIGRRRGTIGGLNSGGGRLNGRGGGKGRPNCSAVDKSSTAMILSFPSGFPFSTARETAITSDRIVSI